MKKKVRKYQKGLFQTEKMVKMFLDKKYMEIAKNVKGVIVRWGIYSTADS